MVGNTGRKCISQGINVIAGGSQCMRYSYKPSLSQKSSKFDQLTHQIVSMLTCEYKIWGWIYLAIGAVIYEAASAQLAADAQPMPLEPVSVVHPEKSGTASLQLPGQLWAYTDAPI